jgi:hypothetical protein
MTSHRPALASAWRCAAVLNGSLAILLACQWANMGLQGLFWKADFSAFYTGWSMVIEGESGALYDIDRQLDHQRRVVPEKPADEGLLPFLNPPHMALTLAPLALLPRPAAFALWTVFQLGLAVLAGRYLLRLQAGEPFAVRCLTLLTVLAFPPLFASFQLGQLSLWGLVCLLGFTVALKEGRPWTTALWVVAGTVKPQLILPAWLILFALRRWRELGLATGLLAVWFGLTTLVLGPRCWLDFLAMLRFCGQQFGAFGMDPLTMYNLKGLLTALLGAGQAHLIQVLTGLAWLAGVIVTLWLCRGQAQGVSDGRLALTFLLAAVVNPHFNTADVLVLVLPAVLFSRHLSHDARLQTRPQALGFAVVAVVCPLLFMVDCYLLGSSALGIRPFFLVMLGVTGWILLSLACAGEQQTLPATGPA